MSKRILVVDDEANIRRMSRLTLEAASYTVSEASDGTQALELFGDGSGWDVVLLDQRMPGLDGLETLRQIRERDRQARVIMVTAFASIELAVDAMKLGARDFVRKPMTPPVLRDAVEAALSAPEVMHESVPELTTPVGRAAAKRAEPLITTLTMNGYSILRPKYLGDLTPDAPNSRRFVVRSRSGREKQVVVNIPAAVITYTERMTRRHLPAENSYWTLRAERVLSNYLWNESRLPTEILRVPEPDSDELSIAANWKDE